MIYVGYQGIGKSSLANSPLSDKFIDLESGNFWVDGERVENWYKIYANIAEHLSKQGKTVFTSSHKVFRNYLKERNINFCVIYPSLSLKDKWLLKLSDRYKQTGLDKDYKALMNAQQMYEENIKDLASEKNILPITDINYNLYTLIKAHENGLAWRHPKLDEDIPEGHYLCMSPYQFSLRKKPDSLDYYIPLSDLEKLPKLN